MKNYVSVMIETAVVCNDCELKERCPRTEKHVPIVTFTNWNNGKGIVTAFCHVKKGGEK